ARVACRHRARARCRTARERPCPGGNDGRDRQLEQALPRARGRSGHRARVTVVPVADPDERSRLADALLRRLPESVGHQQPTQPCIREVAELETLAADDGSGFLSLKRHSPHAAEIYVMGVLPACQRQGVGRALVESAEAWCGANGVDYLQVKTLADTKADENY